MLNLIDIPNIKIKVNDTTLASVLRYPLHQGY